MDRKERKADLLLSRTVHLQSSPGCVTVPGQSADVLQPLHGDSKHYMLLYLPVLEMLHTVHVLGGIKNVWSFFKAFKSSMYLATAISKQSKRENP